MRRAYVLATALIASTTDAIKLSEPDAEPKDVKSSLNNLFDELGVGDEGKISIGLLYSALKKGVDDDDMIKAIMAFDAQIKVDEQTAIDGLKALMERLSI